MRAYTFWHHVLAGFFRFFYNVKVTGLENEPSEGAVIVCANHISFADVIVIGASLNRPLRFLAKKEVFKVPVLSFIVKGLGAYPVDRSSAASAASSIKATVKLLSEGEAVALFPQGHRFSKRDPRGTPIKHGIGSIAYKSGARILPVCIQTKGWTLFPFKRTYITLGAPIEYSELGFSEGGTEEYKAASDIVFERICSLTVHGLYIYTPLDDYRFISNFKDLCDLHIRCGERLCNLDFLSELFDLGMLFIEGASLPDIDVIWRVKASGRGFLPYRRVGLYDCNIGRAPNFSMENQGFSEFLVWSMPENSDRDRELWKAVPAPSKILRWILVTIIST